jgi:nucleoside-triphosphatase THEP1
MIKGKNRIIFITGEKNSGKTTFLKYFVRTIAGSANIEVDGFIAEAIIEFGHKTGFRLHALQKNNKKLLCSEVHRKKWIKMGRFYFNPEGFRFGDRILSELKETINCVIIDEYGPLELREEGWHHSIGHLLKRNGLTVMIAVRSEILPEVVERFNGHEMHIFNINQSTPAAVTSSIRTLMSF